jgi:pimeloyl-ACP methyl ester carboxylesterase
MRPAPYHLGPNQKIWQEKAHKIYDLEISKLGKNIRIFEYGEGPEILLIHGWGGRGLQLSPLISPLLEKGRKVVIFDAPGHGDSEGIGSTYIEFVIATLAVAEQYSSLQAVIAHSMGGGAAMVLASKLDRANFKTVLLAPHFDMQKEFYQWAENMHVPKKLLRSFIALSEKQFQYQFDLINPKNLASTQKGPYLLVHDRNDKAAQFKSSELLKQNIPNADFLATDGKGHNKIIKDPDVISKIISFLG